MSRLRHRMRWLARTPFHPQWLLGPRRPPARIAEVKGVLLDVGSADGWLEDHLGPDAEYVSLDYPPTGQALYGARPSVYADAARMPFGDGTVHAIACLEVIEHVPCPDLVLGEMHRVLKPGGHAFLSMPFLYPIHDAPHDFTRLTLHGWRQQAAQHGFLLQQIAKRTHSLRTAGLLACLAISGAVATRAGLVGVLFLPLAAASVLMINILTFLGSLLLPDWEAMGSGYELVLLKPESSL